MVRISQVAVVVGLVAGVGIGCSEPRTDKKLDLKRETLRQLDAGAAAVEPRQPTRHTPPTNLPPEEPPPPRPVTHQAPR